MHAVDFCYWLQGAFELASIPLTVEQIACVQKHLATPQTGQPKQATDFCSWLRGGLDFITPGDARQVETIRAKLNGCFEHAIDSGKVVPGLRPTVAPNGNPIMRC